MSFDLLALALAGMLAAVVLGVRVWRRRPAVRSLVEVVRRYRIMARRAPRRFAPGLALSLHELSLELMATGQRHAALLAVQEAVDIFRLLARAEPKRFEGQLAESLAVETSLLTQMGLAPGEVVREVGASHFLGGARQRRPFLEQFELLWWGLALLVLMLSVAILAYVGRISGAF